MLRRVKRSGLLLLLLPALLCYLLHHPSHFLKNDQEIEDREWNQEEDRKEGSMEDRRKGEDKDRDHRKNMDRREDMRGDHMEAKDRELEDRMEEDVEKTSSPWLQGPREVTLWIGGQDRYPHLHHLS